ncbi:hypothetical protein D5086_014314 [Populus alba]|uniref:Uncharacterized protein n=1 Tax=Populus alba TaxID=43335 RepID=A0ACC4BX50_POPAL
MHAKFSISQCNLLRARVTEEGEGTERKVQATTGFITGKLMFLTSYALLLHYYAIEVHVFIEESVPVQSYISPSLQWRSIKTSMNQYFGVLCSLAFVLLIYGDVMMVEAE